MPQFSEARHGTRGEYERGCRCADCRAANAAWQRDYLRRRRERGGPLRGRGGGRGASGGTRTAGLGGGGASGRMIAAGAATASRRAALTAGYLEEIRARRRPDVAALFAAGEREAA